MWTVTQAAVASYDDHNCRIDDTVENPDWVQVKRLIDVLDGVRYTEMWIEGPNRYVLLVYGGGGRYGVTVIGNDLGPYELLGNERSDEITSVIIGGVSTNVPKRCLVAHEQVLQAAEYFFKTGMLDPLLDWELD